MSIWGTNPLENDDATDWFLELKNQPSLDLIRQALEDISDPTHIGYFEVTDGAEAFAAAEILAELLGSMGDNPVLDEDSAELSKVLREEIQRENQGNMMILIKQAINALEIILNDAENSEFRQMWEEQVEEMPFWIKAMTMLQSRLSNIAIP